MQENFKSAEARSLDHVSKATAVGPSLYVE